MMNKKSPVFIIGAQRSGTTLLRLMLTSHSKICIPPESQFLVNLSHKYSKSNNDIITARNFVLDLYEDSRFIEWKVNKNLLLENLHKEIDFTYPNLVQVVYHTYLQQYQPNSHLWGDKNPDYLFQTEKILKIFPNAKFIHIVRDIRAVFNSVKEKHKLPTNPHTLDEQTILFLVTYRWYQSQKICSESNNNKQFYFIKYENLICETQKELKRLCNWLNINFEPSMINFYEKNITQSLIPDKEQEIHKNTYIPVTKSRINAWKNSLTSCEIDRVETLNYFQLRFFGYSYYLSQHKLSLLKKIHLKILYLKYFIKITYFPYYYKLKGKFFP